MVGTLTMSKLTVGKFLIIILKIEKDKPKNNHRLLNFIFYLSFF